MARGREAEGVLMPTRTERRSDQDAQDLEALERAADDLCVYLNEGFSVDARSQRRGIEPFRQLKQSV
jgi:hypothetical protein